MVHRSRTGFRGWAFAVAMLGIASGAFAQSQTGNVYGNVRDDKGEPLPGVTLTLSGGGAPSIQVSDAQGAFRFIGVYPGTYKLEGALQGFSPVVYPSLVVNLNRNTTLELQMSAAVEETITITAESPLLDARKITTGATVDKTELEKIPTARDPWVILQTTPGVLVDRVNVGGNESGQQSNYVGNGDDGTNSSWSIDGVEITDFGAIGSSSSYYDFDAFEEMQVTTGGSDASARTGGVGLNLVTKRGTNEWRGSGRYIVADQDWQSSFNANESDFGQDYDGPSQLVQVPGFRYPTCVSGCAQPQEAFKQGNRIVEVLDYGLEAGGPIVRDKLWIWGSYGKNDIKLLTVSDFPDNSQLETWNAKFNWQVAQNNSATVFFSNNDKTKQGRNAGPTRPQETTWNQESLASDPNFFGFWSERPTASKIEDTHIFGSNFFLTGSYAESDGGFQLVPQGGISTTQANASLDAELVFHNTYLAYYSERPQDQFKADASYFFSSGNLNHELKFGANWREATVRSNSFWPGFGLDLNYYIPNYGYYYNIVQITRPSSIAYQGTYTNGYVQDTITAGNLTANVGFRYDRQETENLPTSVAANSAFPDLLPAASFAGGKNPFTWETFSPRLGLTYALGEEKKTLLRLSYSRFAEQIGSGYASVLNPLYPGAYTYLYYEDRNGDDSAQPGEVLTDIGILFQNSPYNPNNPAVPLPYNDVDPNLDAPISDEIVVGVEHALRPEFVIGLTGTYRIESDIIQSDLLIFDGDAYSPANTAILGRRATRADYVLRQTATGPLPDGSTYTVPLYDIAPGLSSRGGGYFYNGDREREYLGVSATFNKRLSNQWMMRGNVTWNDWTWNVPDSSITDPTQFFGGGNHDGDRVLTCSGTGSGSKAGVCISSSWSYSLSGMYQVAPDKPWGFNLAGSLNGREGYANPYFRRIGFGAFRKQPFGTVLVNATEDPDSFQNDDLHILDLRVEKEFKFDRLGLTLGVDVFNVTNEGTVLQRNLRLNTTYLNGTSDHVQEVVSPRIFRLGAKFSFN
jgi:hypothetical protein